MNLSNVLRVAFKELRYLFLSPIGWIILAVFFIQTAYQFVQTFDLYFQRLALDDGPRSFARELFTNNIRSTYQTVIFNAYLFIPLVTMAVFARELQSGAIKLFMSSPIRPSEIVLGKFLGVVGYLFCFVLALVLMIAIAAIAVPQFDWPATLPGLLGIFLLVCTYAAIGLFVSSLTQHQVVAAIATLTILFVLQSIAGWLQTVPWLNEITAWASLAGRANTFRAGLIATPDLVYFLVLIGLFLAFTVLRISQLRSGEQKTGLGVKAASVTAVAVVLGWVLSQPQLSAYLDMTYDQRNSLAPESMTLMERLEGPWEIVTYANFIDRMGWAALPNQRINDRQRYTYYRHINPDLSMRYELYYDFDGAREALSRPDDDRSDEEIVGDYAQRIGLDVDEIPTGPELDARVDIDLAAEGFRTLRVLRWNGREVILRHFLDPTRFPDERTRAAGIKQLLDGPVIVGMATGQGERSLDLVGPRDYELRFNRLNERFSLLNHGFEYAELDVSRPVPNDVDILMIADPRVSYTDDAIAHVRDFIERGGDMALLLEADSPATLDELLADLGLESGQPVLQTEHANLPPEFLLAEALPGVIDAYWGASMLTGPVILDGAVSIQPLSDDAGFVRKPMLRVGENVMAYALERRVGDENQRIVVFGDADVFSNANAERIQPLNNRATAFDTFHWLTDGEYPVQRTRRAAVDRSIRVGGQTMTAIRWLLIGILPLAILLAGAGLLLFRRRR